jgi:hypothetical protein
MQGLDPLAVFDVTLATRDALDGAGTDPSAVKTKRFKILKDEYPVDAGTFHCNGTDLVRLQPISDSM